MRPSAAPLPPDGRKRRAVEDASFALHGGVEWDAIRKAWEYNQKQQEAGRSKMRGGSTISQQTAKNAFLWQGGGYFRKGLEAWFTLLIETIWGKRRIMEVYLNSIEWGPGVYGAEAAAQAVLRGEATLDW